MKIEGINPKTLSQRLKVMHKDGLIERKMRLGTPVKIEYFLTDSGRALRPILDQLIAFSINHFPKDVCKDGVPTSLELYRKKPAN